MPTQQQIDSTTQKFLDIFDITNDLVILKDGTTSLILTVDAMNFGLLAEEEQDSIMYAYAGLLNSLNYPIQILVKSQTKDVTGYLRLLKEQEDATLDIVQRKRIMKYREFVSNLIRERNVLDKKFYVTIPAKPLELGLVPISSVVPGQSQTDVSTIDKSMIIEKAKGILEPKRDHLIAQFARIGLYSRQLETQEIIQMFYQSYNPEAFEGQTMGDSKTYTAPLVSASIEENNTNIKEELNQETPITSQESTISSTNLTPPSETKPSSVTNNPQQTQDYSPTNMTNSENIVQTPLNSLNTETQNPAQINNPTVPNQPSPSLSTTNINEINQNIPQEVEIKIDRPNRNETIATESKNINQGSDTTLPPLPEIK